jgi:RimJ/RimL family protein N-acetyltransferase
MLGGMGPPFGDRPPLEGKLVRLRAREQADVVSLNTMFDDQDVLAGLQMAFPQPVAGFREWMEATRRSSSQAVYAIETLQAREAVGICGLEEIDARARAAAFGIWIGKPYWGRGYGTDATRTACRFGFRHMNLQRISLCVYATNQGAVRVYEKAGFKHEGTSRRGQFLGGRHVDVMDMGLLAEELVEEERAS